MILYMKIIDFLEENKNNKIIIEEEKGIIKKVFIEKFSYEIEEDNLYISSNQSLVVINLNLIRNVEKGENKIEIILDDKKETIINFSVI